MSKIAQNVMFTEGSMSHLETGFGTNLISAKKPQWINTKKNESLL